MAYLLHLSAEPGSALQATSVPAGLSRLACPCLQNKLLIDLMNEPGGTCVSGPVVRIANAQVSLLPPCDIFSAPNPLRLSLEPLKAAVHLVVLSVSPNVQPVLSVMSKCHLKCPSSASQQLCVPLQMHTTACGTPAATCPILCLATT